MKYLKQISIGLIAILLIGFGVYFNVPKVQAACGNGYSYCQQLTIDHTQAGGTDSSNWVGLFATSTDSSLAVIGSGGHVNHTDNQTGSSYTGTVPADFVITSDSGCVTKLNFEFVNYVSTTGAMKVYFNWGTLSHSSDGHPWICYGNTQTSFQGNVNGTWPTEFKEVYHMEDAGGIGNSMVDSTVSANTMHGGYTNCCTNFSVGTVSTTTGQIVNAINFSNTNQYNGTGATSTSVTGFGTASNYTVDAWSYISPSSGYDVNYNSYLGINGSGGDGFGLTTDASGADIGFVVGNGSGGKAFGPVSGGAANTWVHTVGTYDGTTMKVYINGSFATSTLANYPRTSDGLIEVSFNPNYTMGCRNTQVSLDDVEIINTVETADWILAQYNNTKTNSTMITAGAEQQGTTTPPPAEPAVNIGNASLNISKGSLNIGQ